MSRWRKSGSPLRSSGHKQRLTAGVEGKIFLAGLFLLAFLVSALGLSWFFFPRMYQSLAAVIAGAVLFGRGAGISVGFAADLSFWSVIVLNVLIETTIVLLFYPLFVFSWRSMLKAGRLQTLMERFGRDAQKYRPQIQRYGPVGLFLFVWIPFWMTGPMIGSFIGYLMGLRHLYTLAIVLLGTLLATICWAYFLSFLQNWARAFHPMAPWLVVGAVVLFVLVGAAVNKLRRQN
jgi:uncharacterized membrane protein